MSGVHVWTDYDGETYIIPDDIYAATKFARSGWPDRRMKCNAAFHNWLHEQRMHMARLTRVRLAMADARKAMEDAVLEHSFSRNSRGLAGLIG